MSGYPLVLIEWEDSAQPIPGWQWVDKDTDLSIVIVKSVGWLVRNIDGMTALVPNTSVDDNGDVQGSGLIKIPTRSVLNIVILKQTELYPT